MQLTLFHHRHLLDGINPFIRLMILSDVLLVSGGALLGPIFALFITGFIEGGTMQVAGTAATVYLLTKSVLQLPVSLFIDKIKGELDDYGLLIFGTCGLAVFPLAYLVISTPSQLYIIQCLYGALAAITFPSYMAIFTRHIDERATGRAWGLYYTVVDLGSAITASIGGILAVLIGFEWVIIGMVILRCIGAAVLFHLRKQLHDVQLV